MNIETGKTYRLRNGERVGPVEWREDKGYGNDGYWVSKWEGTWFADGRHAGGPEREIVAECVDERNDPVNRPAHEFGQAPPVFREPAAAVADLAIAYPVDDRIGFTLTVAGKPQKFEMTREAAAHFAGRIAEALSK